jgi:hypothetical protein
MTRVRPVVATLPGQTGYSRMRGRAKPENPFAIRDSRM